MTVRPKTSRMEALVEALGTLDRDPRSEEAERIIREGLVHRHWMPVEHASRVVAQHSLAKFTPELLAVWGRFLEPGQKLDPNCRAKEAALVALDALEWFDPEPFLEAIRYRQFEPGFGGSTDTAGKVRQRALFALLRQHHPQALLYAGELLADPLVEVRVATADALYQYGGPNAAPLLVHCLRLGDDARVMLACALALLELDCAFGCELLREWLGHSSDRYREVAALSLGQCKAAEAGELLITWFDELAWDRDLELAARALSLQRNERARGYLLERIAGGGSAHAQAAIRALSTHRYDPKLCNRVRDAVVNNPDPKLRALVDDLFVIPVE